MNMRVQEPSNLFGGSWDMVTFNWAYNITRLIAGVSHVMPVWDTISKAMSPVTSSCYVQ